MIFLLFDHTRGVQGLRPLDTSTHRAHIRLVAFGQNTHRRHLPWLEKMVITYLRTGQTAQNLPLRCLYSMTYTQLVVRLTQARASRPPTTKWSSWSNGATGGGQCVNAGTFTPPTPPRPRPTLTIQNYNLQKGRFPQICTAHTKWTQTWFEVIHLS